MDQNGEIFMETKLHRSLGFLKRTGTNNTEQTDKKYHDGIKTRWLVDQNNHPQMVGCLKRMDLSSYNKQDTIIYIVYVMSYLGFRGLMLPFASGTSCYPKVKIDSTDAVPCSLINGRYNPISGNCAIYCLINVCISLYI